MHPNYVQRGLRAAKGFALVIVLCLITIVAVLLVAFIGTMQSNSVGAQSYSEGMKAEQICRGAFVRIECLLAEEIAANSQKWGGDGTNGEHSPGPYVYLPERPWNIRVEASGVPTVAVPSNDGPILSQNPPLVKISRHDGDFYLDGGHKLTSSTPTTTRSSNGRYISLSRWNKPRFFAKWPDGTDGGAAIAAPDWVNVTRSGPAIVSIGQAKDSDLINSNFVVGRYAYAVYDVSGLLDITAAGYPSSGSDLTTDYISGKTSLALADLTNIPNPKDNDSSRMLTSANIDALCSWRNRASKTDLMANYLTKVLPVRGGLSVYLNPSTGLSDDTFINRQDLIRYASDHDMTGSLPYLTSFRRSVNVPSWSPQQNSDSLANYQGGVGSSIFNYKANENLPGSVNRNLPNVRCQASPGTYMHYESTGTATSFTLAVGDTLLRHRFSLKKLSWLGKDGPNVSAFEPSLTATQRSAAIRACFGLVWNNSTKCWDYDALDGSNKIYTLQGLDSAQAALSSKREPNFFELLKAGILEGSLARGPGAVNTNGAQPYGPGADVDGLSSGDPVAADTHIFRIGASIIDQSDADNFPTTIYTGQYPVGSPYGLACGIENLPYLLRCVQGAIDTTPPTFTDAVDNNDMLCWFRPVLWNPHQAGTSVPGPAKLRIQVFGLAAGSVIAPVWNPAQNKSVAKSFGSAAARWATAITLGSASFPAGANDAWITFMANQDFSTAPDTPKGIYIDTAQTPSANIPWFPNDPSPANPSFPNKWAVFAMPKVRYDPDTTSLLTTNSGVLGLTTYKAGPSNSGYASFALQWEDPDSPGYWRTYSICHKIGGPNSITQASTYRQSHYLPGIRLGHDRGLDNFVVFDPRTSRFGTSLATYPGAPPQESTIRAGTTSPDGINGFRFDRCPPWNTSGFSYITSAPMAAGVGYFPAALMQNRVDSRMRYAHKDGVVRGGDGYYASTQAASYASTLPNGVSTILGSGAVYTEGSQRPLVLNRPFRSVGELGYTFRDEPFKTLDFFTNASADSALLELFCIDEAPLSTGKLNPLSAPTVVLNSLINGSVKKEATFSSGATYLNAQTPNIAASVKAAVNGASVTNRGDLVAPFSAAMTAVAPSLNDNSLTMNKTQREAPVRAMIEAADVRTWNLMIDVIAQAGRYSPRATNLSEGFIVEGERRYWMHIAIDRFSGKVLTRQLELVYE